MVKLDAGLATTSGIIARATVSNWAMRSSEPALLCNRQARKVTEQMQESGALDRFLASLGFLGQHDVAGRPAKKRVYPAPLKPTGTAPVMRTA